MVIAKAKVPHRLNVLRPNQSAVAAKNKKSKLSNHLRAPGTRFLDKEHTKAKYTYKDVSNGMNGMKKNQARCKEPAYANT
jgi:hypothetical protein